MLGSKGGGFNKVCCVSYYQKDVRGCEAPCQLAPVF